MVCSVVPNRWQTAFHRPREIQRPAARSREWDGNFIESGTRPEARQTVVDNLSSRPKMSGQGRPICVVCLRTPRSGRSQFKAGPGSLGTRPRLGFADAGRGRGLAGVSEGLGKLSRRYPPASKRSREMLRFAPTRLGGVALTDRGAVARIARRPLVRSGHSSRPGPPLYQSQTRTQACAYFSGSASNMGPHVSQHR